MLTIAFWKPEKIKPKLAKVERTDCLNCIKYHYYFECKQIRMETDLDTQLLIGGTL